MDDALKVLDALPSSAPGPDMIPFMIHKRMKDVVAPLFLALAKAMLESKDNDMPPRDFNFAFLICLPKKYVRMEPDGTEVFEASGTRPLSLVDASNRILANIFRVILKRNAAAWLSDFQQGFQPVRSLLRNVLDVDLQLKQTACDPRLGLFSYLTSGPPFLS